MVAQSPEASTFRALKKACNRCNPRSLHGGQGESEPAGRGRPVHLAILVLLEAGSLGLACQPECERLDVIFSDGFARPDTAPDEANTFWVGGEGGLSVLAGSRDEEVFEPLYDHFIVGTSTVVGMAKWSLRFQRDRVFVIEHPMPLERGATFRVDTFYDGLEFTGGDGTPTWWDTNWGWTRTATTPARAVFTEAFETVLTTEAVRGTVEVRQVEPLELRIGLLFDRTDGTVEAYWGDVQMSAQRGFDPCPG